MVLLAGLEEIDESGGAADQGDGIAGFFRFQQRMQQQFQIKTSEGDQVALSEVPNWVRTLSSPTAMPMPGAILGEGVMSRIFMRSRSGNT